MDGRSYRSRMHRVVGTNLVSTLLCILPFVGHGFARVPYTPSSLLYSSQQNDSFAYLLRATDTAQNRPEFLSLDVSKGFDAANPSYTVLLDEAPFHKNHESVTYIPAIDQAGVIKIYAGGCLDRDSTPMLWRFKGDPASPTGNGTWEKYSVQGLTPRPRYLSAAFTYTASNTTESSLFAFAGMCPYQSASSNSWVNSADYSQTMTVLEPGQDRHTYQGLTTGARGPPIPEAGFTITPLQPTYAYSNNELQQQQDFLIIGGHTQQAFINMSELAIFSAPQNSWSFVTVGAAADSSKSDLVFRDAAAIEPRSGHSAVLSPDGSKVIVFGGWVGNTSVPASPQLAILEIGEGFGGSGEWAWKVPPTSGVPAGSGVYGHGATMLPGGVMMIAGGYEITQLSKRSERGPRINSQVYLYDVSADTWATAYEYPYSVTSTGAVDNPLSPETNSSSSRKAGLGVGLGLGIPAAAGLGVFLFYFYRRRKIRRTRDKEIRKLALGAQRAHFWGRDESEMASSIRNPSMTKSISSDYPWNDNNRPKSLGKRPNWTDNGDAIAERTGLLGDIHAHRKPNRPALNASIYRPPYHDFTRGDIAGIIHPIDEREEDEAYPAERIETRETMSSLPNQAFVTARNTQVEILTGSPMNQNGPLSPSKDEGTLSSHSDSSTSAKSTKSGNASQIRSNEVSILLPKRSPSPDKSTLATGHSRDATLSQDSAITTSTFEKRYSSDSYSTAHSAFSQQQAEGESLLRDRSEPSPSRDIFDTQSVARPRASEWLGEIRRVLSVSRRRPRVNTGNTASQASGIDGRNSMIGLYTAESRVPRRSASASAELFRRRQGAKDWGVGNRLSHDTGFHSARSTRDDFGLDGFVDLDGEDEWDVERAAEGRRVQVTFTVPKEKLRVVNATARDMDDLSEKSVSRSNSSS
ncbi:hypothetical protein BJX61DRAFT_139960 [Aspergillus egyptiacus]|nr:hypothetical protein BJX61DRAFT_139960 [Aspergillus egyptiacus]